MAGMSFSSLPNAPGAPFAQSGMGSFIWACNWIANESERADAKRVFMIGWGRAYADWRLFQPGSLQQHYATRQGVGMERRKTIGPRKTTDALLIIKLHCFPHNFEILARDGIVGIDTQRVFKMEHRAICVAQFGENKSEIAVRLGVVGVDADHVFILGDGLGQFLLRSVDVTQIKVGVFIVGPRSDRPAEMFHRFC